MAGRVRIDRAQALAAVGAMSQEAVMRGANRYRERVREEILRAGRVETGEMHRDITVRPLRPTGLNARAQVSPQTEHFIYQDQGTKPYVSPPGQVMVWRSGGSGGVFVFARRRRGVEAGRFLAKAQAKMQVDDFT